MSAHPSVEGQFSFPGVGGYDHHCYEPSFMDFCVDARADFPHGLRSRAGTAGRVKAEHFKELPPFPLGALGVPTSDMGARAVIGISCFHLSDKCVVGPLVALLCISLPAKGADSVCPRVCLRSVRPLGRCLSGSFAHFLSGWFVPFCLVLRSFDCSGYSPSLGR